MAIEHKDIPEVGLHEPKGVSAAGANQVYLSDGAGSGSWTGLSNSEVSGLDNANFLALNIRFDDISTSGSHYIVAPVAGDITEIYSVIANAITLGDATITFNINGGGVTLDAPFVVQYTGSAAQDVDNATATGSNTVAPGDVIEIISDGGSTTACVAEFTILLDVS